jgi:protein-L-isoaspartate(D-aspartate) O-methyltransferase
MDLEIARRQMIGQQLRAWDVFDERVLEVMSLLPRENFVAPGWRGLAYADAALPIGEGRDLAAPKIQGRALQALLPRPDDRVLELGSGTGYLTACLARLARDVTGVESCPVLASAARGNLAALGIGNAEILAGDALAMEFPGRFDVICVNGAVYGSTSGLEALLEEGGRLFIVTGRAPVMEAKRITRTGSAEWVTETLFETCLPPLATHQPTPEFCF